MRTVMAFKCAATSGHHDAWCTECVWSLSASPERGGGSKATKAAKRHTLGIGHETRIDVRYQRGYRAREVARG